MGEMIDWLRTQLNREEAMLSALSDAPDSILWKPGDEAEHECISIEVDGTKHWRRIWSVGTPLEHIEWGWTTAGAAVTLFSHEDVRRRLASVQADREILEEYGIWSDDCRDPSDANYAAGLERAIRARITQYTDRDGFRPEWVTQ